MNHVNLIPPQPPPKKKTKEENKKQKQNLWCLTFYRVHNTFMSKPITIESKHVVLILLK